LQLISTNGRHENRQQEITRISRSIKSLAKELDVPVIFLSQLNRALASRSNFMPRLTDLRESGSIEQDADVVLLLHREDYYHKGQADYCNTNVADVIIAKQRNGPTGAIKLTFRPELSRFESYALAEAVEFWKILYFLDSASIVWYIENREVKNREVITMFGTTKECRECSVDSQYAIGGL
jgi:replicative DNA helicase